MWSTLIATKIRTKYLSTSWINYCRRFLWQLTGKGIKCQVRRMTWRSNMKSAGQFIYLKRVFCFYRVTSDIYHKVHTLTCDIWKITKILTLKQVLFHLDLNLSQFFVKKVSEGRFSWRISSIFHQTDKKVEYSREKPMPAEAMHWRLKPQLNETVCQIPSCILNTVLSYNCVYSS